MKSVWRVAVVVNPASARGRTGRRWPMLERAMREILDSFAVYPTRYRGHAEELTRHTLKEGYDRIVSVGGDGTHHEVLNGFFDGYIPINPAASMAIVPEGTGSDFARTLGLDKDADAIRLIREGYTMKIDVGRVTYTTHDGQQQVEYFLNIADFGMGGAVVTRADGSVKYLGPRLAYRWGLVSVLATFRAPKMIVQIDGEVIEDQLLDVIVANGQYYGGGMHVAKDARLHGGHLEVIVIPRLPLWESFPNLPKFYDGSFVENPRWATTYSATHISARSDDRVLLNLDGEAPGRLPIDIEALPGAILLVIGVQPAIDHDFASYKAGTLPRGVRLNSPPTARVMPRP